MNKSSKRILSLLLAIVMVAGMLEGPISMFAVNAVDTEPSALTDPIRVYYNNDFSKNADGITFSTDGYSCSEHITDGEYLYLRSKSYNPVAFWNKGADGKAVLDLPEQFVVSFDFAAIATYATWELHLVDENGNYIRVLSGKQSGTSGAVNYLYSGSSGANSPKVLSANNNKFNTITLAFDMTANKYSYTFNNNNGGVAEKPDLTLRGSGEGGAGEFGTVQYIEIEAYGDDTTAANLIIDNLKIYEGTEVLTDIPAQNQPTDPNCHNIYENDFSKNTEGLTISSYTNNHTNRNEAGEYLCLSASGYNDPVVTWDATGTPNQFTVSFDLTAIVQSSDYWPAWELRLYDESNRYIRVLSSNGGARGFNYLYSGGGSNRVTTPYAINSTINSLTYIPVSLTFDKNANTYSIETWNYNKAPLVDTDLPLRGSGDGGTGDFGTVQYIGITARDDYKSGISGGYLVIDDFKVSVPHTYTSDCDPYCDVCNAPRWGYAEHVDANKDHNCDENCGVAVGTHVAAEGKHTCDYCGQIADKGCVDAAKDHICDICGGNVGTHEAAAGKHTCDYCGQIVNECVDTTPKDHVCDICGIAVGGAHASAAGGKLCDYCGLPVDEHFTVPTAVYYNNNFAENADGITFDSWQQNYSNHDATKGYLYLRANGWNDGVAYWNKGSGNTGILKLPEQFVVSFDFAAIDKYAEWELRLVDESGNYIIVMSGKPSGVNYLYSDGTSNKAGASYPKVLSANNDKFNTVTLAFDMTVGAHGKYSYTYDNNNGGETEMSDLLLRGSGDYGTGEEFGEVQYIAIKARGDDTTDDTTPANLLIDNLKVYGGTEVLTDVSAQNQPEDPWCELYSNDFSEDIGELRIVGYASGTRYDEENEWLHIGGIYNYGKMVDWNYSPRTYTLPNKFAVSFDYAAIDKWSEWEFRILDKNESYIRVLSGSNSVVNHLYDGSYDRISRPASTEGNVEFVSITMEFDMEEGTYSFTTVDASGQSYVKEDFKLRAPTLMNSATSFDDVAFFAFTSYDSSETGNLIIDNFKVSVPHTYSSDCDNFCNVCEAPRWDCADHVDAGRMNHKCDKCGATFTTCVDTDPMDHNCDICGGHVNYRYFDSDFEDKKMSMDDLMFQGGAQIKQEENGNRYVDMVYQSRWSFNYYRMWKLPELVVSEFSVRTSLVSTMQVEIYDTSDRHFTPITLSMNGTITPAHAATLQKLNSGEWVNMAVAVNSVDKTYSVWYDGVLVVDNAQIPTADFGTMGRIVFSMPYGEMATANGGIDNLKVYQGSTPDDYEDTVLLTEHPMDESYLDESLGEESPFLDYAAEELAIINSANAVMVNTNTLYIYENGQRRQGTKDEVDSILAETAGKTEVRNGLGLVIISDSDLGLSDDQIESLFDYMHYTRPTAQTLKDLFNDSSKAHPRVILNADRLAQLKSDYANNNATVVALADRVISSADQIVTGKHIAFTDESFTNLMHNRYQTLSLAYLLTEDVEKKTQYKDYLWEDIQGVCEFPHWRTNEYLATADGTAGMAIAYDWLYNVWTEEQREVMEEAMYEKALYFQHQMIYGEMSGAGTYIASPTNRNAVTNGGIGLACMALFDVYPEKVADILEKSYHMLEIMLDDFAPDGANTEGPAYWDYLMMYYVPFLQTSFNTFGTDFNLLKAPGFDKTLDFYLDVDGMTGINNFHDSAGDDHGVAGEALALATMLERSDLAELIHAKMEIYDIDDGISTLLNYDTSIKYDGSVEKALDGYYKGMEVFSMRSSWTDSSGIFVSAHSGKIGISHDQVDSGTFVLDIGGQRFASDLGKEGEIGAVNELSYYYYRKRPEGHNVFVINPDETGKDIGMNTSASDVISNFVSTDAGAYAIMPLNSAYEGYADSAVRGIMLGDGRSSVLIRDEIRGMNLEQNEVHWFMQMENVTVDIAADGRSAILTKGGVSVHMQVASDNATSWRIEEQDARESYSLDGLPGVDKQNPNNGYKRLAIVFQAGKDLDINVKFAQLDDIYGDTPIEDVAIENWSNENVNSYTVAWVDEDGTVLETDRNVPSGADPKFDGNEPTKEDTDTHYYTFIGWDKEISKVTGNVTYTAQYQETALVTFVPQANVVAGNNLDMAFALNADDVKPDDVVVITRTYGNGNDDEVIRTAVKYLSYENGYYIVMYEGLAAKEMSDKLTLTVENAEGRVISIPKEDSMREYAMRGLRKEGATELEKRLFVDMLIYGAEAQKFFGYDINNLATKGLTEDELALASESKTYDDNSQRGNKCLGSNLIIKSNISFRLAFRGMTEDMYAVVTYTDHMGNDHEENYAPEDIEWSGSIGMIFIDTLVLADARQVVTIKIYDAENNLYTTCQDSIEAYLARGGNESDVYAAIMKFSDTAREYLKEINQ